MSRRSLSCVLWMSLLPVACAPGDPDAPRPIREDQHDLRPMEAQDAILAAFDRVAVVGIGNPAHRNKDLDDFILALIRNPALPGKVNDIAVECGNSLYQDVLDRYIAGEEVALSEARQVWRNTTQPSCGTSGFYEQLFPLVRRINQKLAPERRLRMLACDPAVDWSRIRSSEDLAAFADRDASVASIMEKEVLAKQRKALMLFGVAHLFHGKDASAVGRYEKSYPDVTLVITEHRGFGNDTPLAAENDELESRMASWPVPSLAPVQGTWLSDLEVGYFFPREDPGVRLSSLVDAYLYLGPRDLVLRQPVPSQIMLDEDYMAELERRAASIGELGGPMDPATIRERAAESSAFFYDPPPSP